SSCAKDYWGDKPTFYLKCPAGFMIIVTNAILHPERTSKSCDVQNTPDCTHNFTERAAANCEYREVCRIPLHSYIGKNKGSCCEEIWCHEIDYYCIEAKCREPPAPLNGTVVTRTPPKIEGEALNSWDRGGLAMYTCDNNFELVGQDTRTCDRSPTWHLFGEPDVEYKWNVVAPMCNIRRNLCPPTSNKMEVHGHMCYEFFQQQSTTHDQAQTACEVKKGWSIAVVANHQVLNIIRNHLNLQIRSSQKYWVKVHPDFADELDATWCTYAFLRYTSYGVPVAKLGYYEPLKGEYDKCNRTYGYICQYEPIPVAECAALEIPDNGYINASDNRTVGSVATLGCNPGYIDVNGQDTVSRTCLKSGLWSGRSPDCKDFRPVETTTTPIPTTSTTMPLFQPHKGANESSCAKDKYGDKPTVYLYCNHGEMIKVTNATLHPERTSKSCDVENTPDCTHNFTEIAAAYCEYKEICRMPIQMQSYITTNKGNCCEEIWCHEIDYFCVEAMCREPPSPLNGTVVRKTLQPGKNERFNSWDRNGLATYTCDKNFELVGQDIRTCDRSITYHYGPPEFVFKWNGVAPMCNIRRNLCPSTNNKIEVHGHMCYEFFEQQSTTHDQAQTA
ncbi:unnamed protein product, partial [Owenia fusiformis]